MEVASWHLEQQHTGTRIVSRSIERYVPWALLSSMGAPGCLYDAMGNGPTTIKEIAMNCTPEVIFQSIFFIIVGAIAVIFNRPLGELSSRINRSMRIPTPSWPYRLVNLVVGIFFHWHQYIRSLNLLNYQTAGHPLNDQKGPLRQNI